MEEEKKSSPEWFMFRHATCVVFGLVVYFVGAMAAVSLALLTARETKNIVYTIAVGLTVLGSAACNSSQARDWAHRFVLSTEELQILAEISEIEKNRKKP